MKAKLTVKLNQELIENVKIFAHLNNISLSKMIESYLEAITKEKTLSKEITPLVESLCGVIKMDENIDFKREYSDSLAEKYK